MGRLIDLSVPLEAGVASDPPIMLPQIDYFSHAQTAGQMAGFFDGLTRDDLPGGDGWAVETLTVSSHNGTHLDAPYHHHSTMSGGQRAITIDEVPLEWCFSRGVKLDFRHLPDGHVVGAEEVAAELDRVGHDLRPLDIVVVNTSAGAAYGQPDFIDRGCGMGRAATLYLLERDPSIIWEGHRASIDIGYCHLEKLSNLEALPRPASGLPVSRSS